MLGAHDEAGHVVMLQPPAAAGVDCRNGGTVTLSLFLQVLALFAVRPAWRSDTREDSSALDGAGD